MRPLNLLLESLRLLHVSMFGTFHSWNVPLSLLKYTFSISIWMILKDNSFTEAGVLSVSRKFNFLN